MRIRNPCLVSVSDDSTIVVWTEVEEAVKIRSAAPKEETTDDILMSLIRDHSDEGSISPRFGEEEGFAEML
ncbi:hypothetical protein Pmar_PMAR008245 [Perkinsus marinus ATCC 50983]|uniref:Uncharacterized protein n=1 Tax=Perkinsus marinus (strain ATCC 50983 / TXsc) TaxID=423536 RepID=C5LNP7_PERM5|nr:hypothetical protein Pmar_PMAR008245 [Perkinsus marinus ATCC 50983]EER01666.1 hypothetical protein Pmar_PMAR008245 [Perkinsus marinus ATCC 50983]|eukprot:XP_002768948.1 hypothetical protein Pmar_PMAR008245 [Perkinsus marinus ATCC 50983]